MRPEKLRMFSAVHLHYEIDKCHKTASLLAGASDGVLNNILVESYAHHLRNLIEFLYWTPKKPDDINAVQHVKSNRDWLAARGPRRRADKQVAHLTKKRLAYSVLEKMWRPDLELAALRGGLRLFLEHANPRSTASNGA